MIHNEVVGPPIYDVLRLQEKKVAKVARVVNVEFNTPADMRKSLAEWRSSQAQFGDDIEALISVRTGESSILAIQIFPDSTTYNKFEKKRDEWIEKTDITETVKDRLVLDGEVNHWYQKIQYLHPDLSE
tara:strand:+ start:115 stop:501 length:387 start_codon:yes stop_codon:yes gene_type:complete